jgi:hypothetical protein
MKPGKEVQDKIDEAKAKKEAASSKPFMIAVTKVLSQLSNLAGPKDNVGAMLANAFRWDAAESMCKARATAAWDELEKQGIVNKDGLSPGAHVLADSPSFAVTANVTQPVKRFNADKMADLMVKKFKCSRADALQMVEDAKKEGNSTVRLNIVEK